MMLDVRISFFIELYKRKMLIIIAENEFFTAYANNKKVYNIFKKF